ncbi:hypothetical protein EGT74_26765 [Chitinophaga lutea]|uniref:Uncharacterized protein n=1 Tax=Chitinophaga lutea TaxID=2488634 RepID=A0A3N4PNR0_9BACT|nr:hypothetical protein [Chitinophaga lutea]RPE05957.1 hypothetical protein EGT74_26765 [Chitinophaga lutea]
MRTEQFQINVNYDGKDLQLPVKIAKEGLYYAISVEVDGAEIYFSHDGRHGLRPLCHREDFDPQFLYLLGKEIEHQS